MATLKDIRLILDRAEEHIDDLDGRIKHWTEAQTIETIDDHDPKTGWHTVRVKDFPEPPEKWVAILGDYATNLRTALEYMVQALVLANNGTPNTKNQFPIVFEAKDAHLIKVFLRGVADEPAALIDALQPCHRPNRMEPEALEVIAQYANVHKHSHPHAVAMMGSAALGRLLSRPDREVFLYHYAGSGTRVETWIPDGPQPLVGNAPIFAVRVEPPDAQMNVKPGWAPEVQIAFRNGRLVTFAQLRSLIVEVRAILDVLQPFMGKSQPVTP